MVVKDLLCNESVYMTSRGKVEDNNPCVSGHSVESSWRLEDLCDEDQFLFCGENEVFLSEQS